MRDEQRTQNILSHNATRVADDVCVPGIEPERADAEPRIHAGDDDHLLAGTRREVFQLMIARVLLVGEDDLVSDGHGKMIAASSEQLASSGQWMARWKSHCRRPIRLRSG